MWARSLGWEDLLEEEMATHSSILAWRIPWTEEPGGLQSIVAKSQTRLKRLSTRARMVFQVSTYGCERGTIERAEGPRTDAFTLWRWRRLLRVLWTARRPNQSILKEVNPEYSLK